MMRRFSIALASAIFTAALGSTLTLTPAPALALASSGTISGVVTHSQTKQRIADALVILQCSCLPESRETQTNANGLYAFRDLPPGTYTIQVLSGQADVSKVTTLPKDAKFRANFSIDPEREFKRMIKVEARPVRMSASTSILASGTQFGLGRPMTSGGGNAEPRLSAKERLASHRRDMVATRGEPSSSPGTTSAPPQLETPEAEEAIATDPIPDDFARQVIYTGTMQLAVYNLATAKEEVEALVVEAGGYVQSLRAQTMVLRIPAGDFRAVAATIGKLGRVESQEFEAQDVTEDFYDMQTRIEVLRRTQTQLLSLLDKARTVSDALEVRRELDKVTLELEAILGRQRVLAAQIRFSALSLGLEERIPRLDVPSTNDPFPWVDEIGVEGTAWR